MIDLINLTVLFWELFKTGLFAVGGGMATLPFLYDMADRYDWITRDSITNMIAVSESTPGPIGVNMATYVGFNAFGVLGGVLATLGLVLPSLIIILIIAKFFEKFNDNFYVSSAFYGIRPAATALILLAAINVFTLCVFGNDTGAFSVNWLMLALIAVFTVLVQKTKLHPIVFILITAVLGIVLKL